MPVPVHYDAVVVPCGTDSITVRRGDGCTLCFLAEACKHDKPVAEGPDVVTHAGVVTSTAAGAPLPNEFPQGCEKDSPGGRFDSPSPGTRPSWN